MKKISIFGCGWVGKALAKELYNHYEVMASVQSQSSFDLLEVAYKFLLTPTNIYNKKFYNTDVFIIAIPPRGEYLQTLTSILSHLKPSTQLILLSSTSVYSQTKGVVKEEDTYTIKEPSLMLQAERLVQSKHKDAVILRLGGLMGYDRIAGKYTAGKTKAYDAPVNYIHRDDVIGVIHLCMEKNIRDEVFNVVVPSHPKQSEVYAFNTKKFGFEKTCFSSDEVRGKVVCTHSLIELGYKFLRKDIFDFWSYKFSKLLTYKSQPHQVPLFSSLKLYINHTDFVS